MISQQERREAIQHAWALYQNTGIPLLDHEIDQIEVADFGLSEFKTSGLTILTLAITQDMGIKLIALYPWQIGPEHRHPRVGDYPGKEETFRGLLGQAWGYVPGKPTPDPKARVPEHRKRYYTSWQEVDLGPGHQYTSSPNEWHWFQAGPEGAVILSVSSRPTDYQDDFRDPNVQRQTVVGGE